MVILIISVVFHAAAGGGAQDGFQTDSSRVFGGIMLSSDLLEDPKTYAELPEGYQWISLILKW